MSVQQRYIIKCDDCKAMIGRTNVLGESAAGGKCDNCYASVVDVCFWPCSGSDKCTRKGSHLGECQCSNARCRCHG